MSIAGFSLGRLHMGGGGGGGFVLHMGGDKCRGQSVNRGTHDGGHRP